MLEVIVATTDDEPLLVPNNLSPHLEACRLEAVHHAVGTQVCVP